MNTLEDRIRQLRLPGMLISLESRNAYALENKISYLDFLELLLEDEWARRQYQQQHRKLQQSKLHQQKRLDNYDFSFQPELDKKVLMDLAACRYVHQQQNIIFMGKPGVGKTHLANALGLEAVHQGLNVIFTHANSLLEDLHRAKADGKYHTLLNRIKKLDLLIIDELGFKKIPQYGLDDFFEIIRQRYEKGSIIITTNRSFEDWGPLFGDTIMASAIIDRLIHHATVLKITGDSYRMKKVAGLVEKKSTSATVD